MIRFKLLLSLLLLPLAVLTPPLQAATFTVTKAADTNDGACNADCSLREAIGAANANVDADIINFSTAFNIALNGTQLQITTPLTINGPATVSGNNASRVFSISGGTSSAPVNLNNLLIRNGNPASSPTPSRGGGILSTGVLNLSGGSISANLVHSGTPSDGGGGGLAVNGGQTNATNVLIDFNGVGATGAGVLVAPGASFHARGGEIKHNNAGLAGGGIENNAGFVTLTDVFVRNNGVGVNGGGLHISGAGQATISGCIFNGNAAEEEGGGLWNSSTGTLIVQGSATRRSTGIAHNLAKGDATEQGGGGVFNNGGTVIVSGASLTGNIANAAAVGNGGGGIFNDGSLIVVGSSITGNRANVGELGNGGGILNSNGGDLTVINSSIDNNLANRAGGGIENNAGIVNLVNTNLRNNSTGINGGGYHTGGAGQVVMSGVLASGNVAGQEGGGLWNSANGSMIVQSSTARVSAISGNRANGDDTEQGGGGLFNDGGEVTISNANITGNIVSAAAVGNGGGGIFNAGSMTLNNCSITTNRANIGALGNGGGILNSGFGTLTMRGGRVDNNVANRAGGGIENNLGEVTLTSVSLRNNSAGINGGGFHTSLSGKATFNGCLVSGNVAGQEGGGVWNSSDGTLIIQRNLSQETVISNNRANGDGEEQGGGGIFNDGNGNNPPSMGRVTIRNARIIGNSVNAGAVGNGGGGIFNDGQMTLESCSIIGNRANIGALGSGGGILNTNEGNLKVLEGVISGNMASRAGGGIENNAGYVEIGVVSFMNNTAGLNGGGLHTTGRGRVFISDVVINNNRAGLEGGGLWNSATGILSVNFALLYDNRANGEAADQGGGGLYNDGGQLMLYLSDFIRNAATGDSGSGGGLLNNGGNVYATYTRFLNNQANRAGGGIEHNGNGNFLSLNGCTISGNNAGTAPGNGGGVHVSGNGLAQVYFSTLASNVAVEGAGLWNSQASSLVIDNSTLSGNRATGSGDDQGGGGIYNDGGSAAIYNATIAANVALNGRGGGIFSSNSSMEIGNSIIATNFGAQGQQGQDVSGPFTSSGFNLIGTILGSTGLDDSNSQYGTQARLDPKLGPLAGNGGPTLTHALLEGSPAIDAGGEVGDLPTDQRGFPRVAGERVDIGAFEFGSQGQGPPPPPL